jgi:transposase
MKHVIGIDVSKASLDLALMSNNGELLRTDKVTNDLKSLVALTKQWTKEFGLIKQECLVCLEPTGHYSYLVLHALVQMELPTWLAHPRDIQQSIGNTRGKTDRIDAIRIADYARRFHDKARLVSAGQLRTSKLKQLLTKRDKLVQHKTMHQTQMRDLNKHVDLELRTAFNRIDKAQVTALDKAIKKIETLIAIAIEAEPELQRRYELLLSVDGVGPVLAAHLLAITDGFIRFQTPRELACHAGVAPFPHTSGSSVRGKTHVSNQAHRNLKRLLHISAVGLISRKGELQDYWLRKVAEGKHKMSIFNAVRNKLIHRIYAVMERGTPYLRREEAVAA